MTFGHCEVPRILWKGRRKKNKNPGINRAARRKRAEKKTLVLTLGSPPEKGGEKKNPGINPGQTAGLRFQDLDLDFRTWSCPSVEVLSIRRGPETKIDTWTDRQTHTHVVIIYKMHIISFQLILNPIVELNLVELKLNGIEIPFNMFE